MHFAGFDFQIEGTFEEASNAEDTTGKRCYQKGHAETPEKMMMVMDGVGGWWWRMMVVDGGCQRCMMEMEVLMEVNGEDWE